MVPCSRIPTEYRRSPASSTAHAHHLQRDAGVGAPREHEALRLAVRVRGERRAAAVDDRGRAPQDPAGVRLAAVVDRHVLVLVAAHLLEHTTLVRRDRLRRQRHCGDRLRIQVR